jgi:hypothetical protein
VVKERQKKRKEKRFPFLGVCVYSADSLLSAAAVTTRLFVTAVLELGAKLILQKTYNNLRLLKDPPTVTTTQTNSSVVL